MSNFNNQEIINSYKPLISQKTNKLMKLNYLNNFNRKEEVINKILNILYNLEDITTMDNTMYLSSDYFNMLKNLSKINNSSNTEKFNIFKLKFINSIKNNSISNKNLEIDNLKSKIKVIKKLIINIRNYFNQRFLTKKDLIQIIINSNNIVDVERGFYNIFNPNNPCDKCEIIQQMADKLLDNLESIIVVTNFDNLNNNKLFSKHISDGYQIIKEFVKNLHNFSISIEKNYSTLIPKKILEHILKGSYDFEEFKDASIKFIKELILTVDFNKKTTVFKAKNNEKNNYINELKIHSNSVTL